MGKRTGKNRRFRRTLTSALKFVRWRQRATGWTYGLLVASWVTISVVVASSTGWGWKVYATSAVLFVWLFEIGIATLIAAAWSSHRLLEAEGEAVTKAKRLAERKLRQGG